jgi:hypothetical protein
VIQAILAVILVLFLIGVLVQALGIADTGFPVWRYQR